MNKNEAARICGRFLVSSSHDEGYGLPRRFAPRNDRVEAVCCLLRSNRRTTQQIIPLSLRSQCAHWLWQFVSVLLQVANMTGERTRVTDCHVASLLAMTEWRRYVVSYEATEEQRNKLHPCHCEASARTGCGNPFLFCCPLLAMTGREENPKILQTGKKEYTFPSGYVILRVSNRFPATHPGERTRPVRCWALAKEKDSRKTGTGLPQAAAEKPDMGTGECRARLPGGDPSNFAAPLC
jgi:hypothetical protein